MFSGNFSFTKELLSLLKLLAGLNETDLNTVDKKLVYSMNGQMFDLLNCNKCPFYFYHQF